MEPNNMSRSRKKNPYIKGKCRSTCIDKRNSWKSVRNNDSIVSGNMYRRVFDRRNIYDYRYLDPRDGYKAYMK